MCPASVCPAFVRLSPCRQKLFIEAKRIEAEYDAAKRRCDEAPKRSQAVLETLGRVGSMHAQEARLPLEKELGTISERAYGLINQTITKTLSDNGMSLEDVDVGQGARPASIGRRGVGVVQFPGWATHTELVTISCSLAVSNREMEIPVVNYKNLRKLA